MKERITPMDSYRCDMLDEHSHVIFPADIIAESLEAAIQHAARILQLSDRGTSPSRCVYAFEVWSDRGRLFPAPLPSSKPALARSNYFPARPPDTISNLPSTPLASANPSL
jgi:hypothetical protein